MNDIDIDLLESIAESNDLVLSDNLIQFANAIWKLATRQARKDEMLAKYIEEATNNGERLAKYIAWSRTYRGDNK